MILKTDQSEKYMNIVLKLARRAKGMTSPNPLVGAVIVKDNTIAGQGYHKKAGGPHAEVIALTMAKEKAKGAHLYVNLEPCCHYNRTPPCTDAIMKSGIKEVTVGMIDPNPQVSKKGISILQKNGILVQTGILEKKCRQINEFFIKYITKKTPFVILKIAQSLDGKIATHTGQSKWITNEKSRKFVHRLRSEVDAVLVGIDTVIKDNPYLNVRNISRITKQPKRIILDSTLKIPINSNVLNLPNLSDTIIATTNRAPTHKILKLKKKGITVIIIDSDTNKVDIRNLLTELGNLEIGSLLVEGGSKINASFVESKTVDKVIVFLSNTIIGGQTAIPSIGGKGFSSIDTALALSNITFKQFSDNIMIQGYVNLNKELL